MKVYLSPIGFDTTHLLSLLVRYGVESDDRVILVRSILEDERANRAIEEIEELVKKISDEISVSVVPVDHGDFTTMVLMFVRVVIEAAGVEPARNKVYVNLSGGPREILIALTTACVAVSDRIYQVTSFSDIERSMKVISLPRISKAPDEKEYLLLCDIKDHGPTSFAEIASRLQVSESTISRQCARLGDLQWISIESRGKNKIATITPSGEIMIVRYSPWNAEW